MEKLPEKKWLDPMWLSGYTITSEMGDQISNVFYQKEIKLDWIVKVLEMIWRRLHEEDMRQLLEECPYCGNTQGSKGKRDGVCPMCEKNYGDKNQKGQSGCGIQ